LEKTVDNDSNKLFAKYIETHDEEVRNQIVEIHLPIVDIIVRKYSGKGIDDDDLYQTGAMALVRAVERFDPSLGYEFKSFATPTIIGEIKRYFRDKGWIVQMPRRIKELALKIDDAREKFYADNGRQPKVPDLAEILSASEEEILEAMENKQNYKAYSLSQVMEDQSEDGSGSNIALEKFTGVRESGYDEFENYEFLRILMRQLSEREQVILKERLLGDKTQSETASLLGVSQMTVSRLEHDIREKFRKEYFK